MGAGYPGAVWGCQHRRLESHLRGVDSAPVRTLTVRRVMLLEVQMDIVLWVIAVLALLMAWGTRKKVAEMDSRVMESKRIATTVRDEVLELSEAVATLRKLLAGMAAGNEVDAAMVREGRLFRVIMPENLQKKFTGGEAPYVIDVRTANEWAGGHIPGAQHLPIDDLEKSLHNVKRDGTPMHLICAGGGRSAAASKLLSDRGYLNVFNVEGGMKAWRGDTVKD